MIQALPIDPPGLDAAQAAEFAAMQKLLTLSAGEFSLSSVICNDVALERMLIQALLSSRPGLIHVALAADARDAFELARSRPGATRATGLLVSGFADWLGDENNRTQRIRTLNASRELWQRSFPCPVLFWMNTTVAPRLAYEAPDLWRYRSHRFDLTIAAPDAGSRGMLAAQYADGGDSLSLPRERKLERIAELRQRLAEITDAAPPQMRQHAAQWMIELGNLHSVLGNVRAAMEHYEHALLIAREIGDRRGEGNALGSLGVVHAASGDARKAIEFYEQALFIRRQIGDRQGEAIDSWNLGLRLVEQKEVERGMALLQVWVDYLRELGHPEAEKAAATVEGLRRGDASS